MKASLRFISSVGKLGTVSILSLIAIFSQLIAPPELSASSEEANAIIAEVGDEKISFGQLSTAYEKNLPPDAKRLNELSADSVVSFLKLYSGYRLKVLDAISKGYDKKPETIEEIEINRRRLTESQLFNSALVDPVVELGIKRRSQEFKMAYILIRKDTTGKALEKANQVIEKLGKGISFADLAKQYSDDPNTKDKGGVLNLYITSGRIQPELEEVAYSLEPGQYHKQPISTDMGYFIFKLVDRSPRMAAQSAHILIDVSQVNDGDWEIKKAIADSIYGLATSGADFGQLAKQFSGDVGSAENGGVLDGWYVRSGGFLEKGGKLVEEYENALFTLKDGEISEPVKSKFGYHIIKRLDSKTIEGAAEEEEIKQLYKRTAYEADKKNLLDSLYKTHGFKINQSNFDKYHGSIDENKNNYDSTWADGISPQLMDAILFEFNGERFTIADYVNEMNSNQELKGIANRDVSTRTAIKKIIKPLLMDIVGKRLYKENTDYRQLADEFRDGILLYQVETEEVWSKLKFDSVAAKKYYNDKNLSFKTDYIVDFTEIYLVDEELANRLSTSIENGEDIAKLASEYTERAKYRSLSGKWTDEQATKNRILKLLSIADMKESKVYGPMPVDMGFTIFRIDNIKQPREKTFEEAIPDFATQFQDFRHKSISNSWISSLRDKYNYKVYNEKIEKIVD